MNHKTIQIQELAKYLLDKFGANTIFIVDHWEADNLAIGFTDKKKEFLIYVAEKFTIKNRFFVSLENLKSDEGIFYTTVSEFDNLTLEEVEKVVVAHLRLNDI